MAHAGQERWYLKPGIVLEHGPRLGTAPLRVSGQFSRAGVMEEVGSGPSVGPSRAEGQPCTGQGRGVSEQGSMKLKVAAKVAHRDHEVRPLRFSWSKAEAGLMKISMGGCLPLYFQIFPAAVS